MVVPLAFGWRNLLFANWPIEPELLASHLPDNLTVDSYDGSAWLSVIPFVNVAVRPRGVPSWAGVRLPEVNLRTYVRRDGEPGVYFFSLDAAGLLAVLGARLTHHLPYYYARMGFRCDGETARITSRRRHPGARPAKFSASYAPIGDSFVPDPGSLAAFLTERRRLYTQASDGSLRYTDVDHDRWTLYTADVTIIEDSLFEANGFDRPTSEPTCYYSPGVDVVTSRSKRWEQTADTDAATGQTN